MKCYLKLMPLVFLAACAKGGAGNMCALSSVGGLNPDGAQGKALFTEQAIGSADTLETFGLSGTSNASTEKGVKQGTELTVTVNESCQKNGPISGQLDRSEELKTPSGVRDYTWKTDRDYTSAELRSLLDSDECVTQASDTTKLAATALPTDPMVAQQDHLRAINAGDAYPILLNASSGVRPYEVIAVIDSGIDLTHPDLKDNLWTNTKEIPGNGVDDDHNGYIDDVHGYNFASHTGNPQYQGSGQHHGTVVSGLAAARSGNGIGVSGVMGVGAKIMMLNVFGTSDGAYTSDSANAIRYAVDNGASVINISLGGVGKSAAYESAISYAISHGVTILAAAGNESNQVGANYFMSPAAYGSSFAGLISVGAVNSVDLSWAAYSNYSSTNVEIAAPGSESWSAGRGVLSTEIGGGYVRGHGTSFATPVATGAAAIAASMVRARGYDPNGPTIENVLEASAHTLSNLTAKVKNGGVLDMLRMAQFIDKNYPQKATGPYNGKPGASGYFKPGGCL